MFTGAAVCLALLHLGKRLACVTWPWIRGENGRTNPQLLAVTVGLEEIETLVAIVVVSVEAVHGCLGRLRTWA